MLEDVINAARIGGKILIDNFQRASKLNFDRKCFCDFVSEVDRRSQRAIIKFIKDKYPKHSILAEEEGGGVIGRDYRWIIDPLDGTTNYLHKFPVFAVSIAVEEYDPSSDGFGNIIAGAVLIPISRIIYYAEKDKGAFRNGEPISVSPTTNLEDALLATGFPFRDKTYLDEFLNIFAKMFMHCSGIRRAGSAAQDLCWVAEGVLNGFWERGLSPWDIAAGSLLIKEAGGVIKDFSGGERYLLSGNVVAGNATIVEKMLTVIQEQSDNKYL